MTSDDQTWQARAATSRKARMAPWRDCFIAGAVAGIAVPLATLTQQPAIRAVLILLAVVAGLIGMIRGTLIYMQRIDEQERDANLWGCYVGMCGYLLMYLVVRGAEQLGHPIPNGHDIVFLMTMVITLAVFCWKRFR